MEIGDSFIVDWDMIKGFYSNITKCRFPKREFIIKSFSKSGLSVYFEDNRTNKKCRCSVCSNIEKVKSIGVSSISITKTKIQEERDIKLNKILNGL